MEFSGDKGSSELLQKMRLLPLSKNGFCKERQFMFLRISVQWIEKNAGKLPQIFRQHEGKKDLIIVIFVCAEKVTVEESNSDPRNTIFCSSGMRVCKFKARIPITKMNELRSVSDPNNFDAMAITEKLFFSDIEGDEIRLACYICFYTE